MIISDIYNVIKEKGPCTFSAISYECCLSSKALARALIVLEQGNKIKKEYRSTPKANRVEGKSYRSFPVWTVK